MTVDAEGAVGREPRGSVPWRVERVLHAVDYVSIFVGKLFAWSVLVMTFAISYEVFMRYVMRMPTTWAYDAGYMLYGALFIMAGAYALTTNAHVRGDVVYRFFPTRMKAGVDLALYVIFFFPAVLALIYAGWIFAERSWMIGEHSSATPAGPALYHFKTLIPMTGILLFIQGLAELSRCIFCLVYGRWPTRLSDVKEVDQEALKKMVGKDGGNG